MRRPGRLDRLQADEAADAVVDMDDDIALVEARRLGDEIGGALLAATAHQTVAQDVLLADDGEIGRLEAGLDAQNRRHDEILRRLVDLLQAVGGLDVLQPVLFDNLRQTLARPFGPGREHDPLAAGA